MAHYPLCANDLQAQKARMTAGNFCFCGLTIVLRTGVDLENHGNPHKYWRRNSESNRGTRICNPTLKPSVFAGFDIISIRKSTFSSIWKAFVYASAFSIAD